MTKEIINVGIVNCRLDVDYKGYRLFVLNEEIGFPISPSYYWSDKKTVVSNLIKDLKKHHMTGSLRIEDTELARQLLKVTDYTK